MEHFTPIVFFPVSLPSQAFCGDQAKNWHSSPFNLFSFALSLQCPSLPSADVNLLKDGIVLDLLGNIRSFLPLTASRFSRDVIGCRLMSRKIQLGEPCKIINSSRIVRQGSINFFFKVSEKNVSSVYANLSHPLSMSIIPSDTLESRVSPLLGLRCVSMILMRSNRPKISFRVISKISVYMVRPHSIRSTIN